MTMAVSAFYLRIQVVDSLIGILTIMCERFQSQLFFGERYVSKVGEFFRCGYNDKLIEILGSYER